MVSHILLTSSPRTSASLLRGVFVLSRMTNSSTVRLRLGSGANSFRLTCSCSGADEIGAPCCKGRGRLLSKSLWTASAYRGTHLSWM